MPHSRNSSIQTFREHGGRRSLLRPAASAIAREREGKRAALKLFHDMAENVPAYKHFLRKNRIKSNSIRDIEDFKDIPETDKKNYITRYSLHERCFGGTFSSQKILSVSSGTTGTPTVWPRGFAQDAEAMSVHSALYTDLYEVDKYRTLVVIGFPLGVYVSGMATAIPSFLSSMRHPNISLLTAGNNKEVILATLPRVIDQFEQVVLVGHPFFIKDLIESGKKNGVRWSSTRVRTFFCSEGFSEDWRDYVAKLLHCSKPERDLFSMYGS